MHYRRLIIIANTGQTGLKIDVYPNPFRPDYCSEVIGVIFYNSDNIIIDACTINLTSFYCMLIILLL